MLVQTYFPHLFANLRLCYGVSTSDYSGTLLKQWKPFKADSKSGQYFFKSADGVCGLNRGLLLCVLCHVGAVLLHSQDDSL